MWDIYNIFHVYQLLLLFNLHLSIYICFDKSFIRHACNSNLYMYTLLYKEAHTV